MSVNELSLLSAVTTKIPAALEGEMRTGLKLMQIEDLELVRNGFRGNGMNVRLLS